MRGKLYQCRVDSEKEILKELYPETEFIEGMHPFMLSFCHGADIHDVFTGIDVPQ